MQLHSLLRFLIIVEILALITSVILDVCLDYTLPEALRKYNESLSSIFDTNPAFAFTSAGLTSIALIISWVGLWRLWNPARFIYLISLIASYSFFSWEPFIYTFIGSLFYELSTMAIGAIIVLIFFTDLRHRFTTHETEQGAAANP